MEFPVCNSVYSNEHDAEEVIFLTNVKQFLEARQLEYRVFHAGLCYHCDGMRYQDKPFQSCGGCQLVGYCSRDCQKSDWKSHKDVCKEFPLVKGKNVLWTKGSWKKHINGLLKR